MSREGIERILSQIAEITGQIIPLDFYTATRVSSSQLSQIN